VSILGRRKLHGQEIDWIVGNGAEAGGWCRSPTDLSPEQRARRRSILARRQEQNHQAYVEPSLLHSRSATAECGRRIPTDIIVPPVAASTRHGGSSPEPSAHLPCRQTLHETATCS